MTDEHSPPIARVSTDDGPDALALAVKAAPSGAVLRLSPGSYRGPIVIEREMTLEADGEVEIVARGATTAQVAEGVSATLRGLRLRSLSGDDEAKWHAVLAKGSSVTLEDCEASSETASNVWVEGASARLEARRCRFEQSPTWGVSLADGASGLLEACTLRANRAGGLRVERAEAIARETVICEAEGGGVLAQDGGRARLDRCRLEGLGRSAVQAQQGGQIEATTCASTRCGSWLVRDGGELEADDCMIDEGEFLMLVSDGRLTLRACRLKGARAAAIALEKARASLEACRISGGPTGIEAREGAELRADRCTVEHWTKEGVVVMAGARAELFGCSAVGRGSAALWVGGEIEIEGGDASGEVGILLAPGSTARITDVDVAGCTQAGLWAGDGARVELRRCRLRDDHIGAAFHERARGLLEDCELDGHDGGALHVRERSDVTARRTRLSRSVAGALVHKGGRCLLDACHAAENDGLGLEVREGGELVVRRGSVTDTRRNHAVRVHERSRAQLEDVEIAGAGWCGVAAEGDSDLKLENVRVRACPHAGVWVASGARASLDRCLVQATGLAALEVAGGEVRARATKLEGSSTLGLYVHQGGRARLEGCELRGNQNAGAGVKDGEATLLGCALVDNKQIGLMVSARCSAERCELSRNGLGGLLLNEGADAKLTRCIVRDNAEAGVFVASGGRGLLEGCDVGGSPSREVVEPGGTLDERAAPPAAEA